MVVQLFVTTGVTR